MLKNRINYNKLPKVMVHTNEKTMLPKGLLKEYSRAIAMIVRLFDIFAMVLAGLFAYFFKFGDINLPANYITALLMAGILTWIIFTSLRLYESVRVQGFLQYMGNLIQAVCFVLILLAGTAFLTKTGQEFSRTWFLAWAVFSFLLLILFRFSVLIILRLMRRQGWNERRIVIIGTGEISHKLIHALQQASWTGFRIIEVIADVTDMNSYVAKMRDHLDEIWIALPLSAEKRVKEILHDLRHETITTRFVMDIFGMDLFNHSITHLAGYPIINIRRTPMVGMNRIIKAIEDRVLACIILILISPLLLFIAIAVKLSSPGPIFYRQKRMSWNGKEFDMLKFRTMPVDAELKTGPVWAKQGENRATKIGVFLRKTSLDELPQFMNVLRGDMSIVGPRPERVFFVEQFKDQIPRYMQKHLVKAGITGWAQVKGFRGNTDLEKRIEYDLYYIANWSLALDLKIILLTFFQGFINKNAY